MLFFAEPTFHDENYPRPPPLLESAFPRSLSSNASSAVED